MRTRPLAEIAARELRPLLDEESEHWGQELLWDYSDVSQAVASGLERRALSGLVLQEGARSVAYCYYMLDAGRAIVKTVLLRKGGDELPVDYRLTADGGPWKISDVVIDGVSLAGNFRAQFTKTIRASSYDALVQRIETKLAEEK